MTAGKKKRDYNNCLVPTAVRQPESRRALATKHKLVRKRYQKRGDLTEIITTITNEVTNLSIQRAELTLSLHIGLIGKVTLLMTGATIMSNYLLTVFYQQISR